ncbi:hypothetical protein ACPB8Q_03410 [Methanocaldococcus indicus]|uniref:hypothetical protein n=1 Tax=Methanocaldococcus indicus TaxID=213231 RepID=UPI003C6D99FD
MSKEERQLLPSEIIRYINEIRESIGLKKVDIDIVDIKLENNILYIYTKNRSDKSAIIGPGGWIVGKLKKLLDVDVIKVEDYSDFILFKERCKLIKKFYKNQEVLDISNYFLENKKSNRKVKVLISCQKDLEVLKILKDIFSVEAIILNNNPITPPKVRKNIIEYLEENKIPYKTINLTINFKEVINSYPCGFLSNYIKEEGTIFTTCLSTDIVTKKSQTFINFIKIFPIKCREDLGYCPLFIQYLKNTKDKKFIKDIVEEVYKGALEPTDGAEKILRYLVR